METKEKFTLKIVAIDVTNLETGNITPLSGKSYQTLEDCFTARASNPEISRQASPIVKQLFAKVSNREKTVIRAEVHKFNAEDEDCGIVENKRKKLSNLDKELLAWEQVALAVDAFTDYTETETFEHVASGKGRKAQTVTALEF